MGYWLVTPNYKKIRFKKLNGIILLIVFEKHQIKQISVFGVIFVV
jgi:hypothetical protein